MSRTKQSGGGAAPDEAGAAAEDRSGEAGVGHNIVSLAGRVSGVPQRRELPSGDTVVQLRVVVPRVEPRRARAAKARASTRSADGRDHGARRSVAVDTIDVGVWGKALQRRALKLDDGAQVVVQGALRRRFWRGPAGPVSRYEVEAATIAVARRAARAGGRTE